MNMSHRNMILQAASHFGTPTFLYDMETIAEKYITLRKILTPNCSIFYSIKANPSLGICQYLQTLGSNCEVSSKIELMTALKAGFNPDQIIYAGPLKKTDELKICIETKIKLIICESLEEIYEINEISTKMNVNTPLLIRINPDFSVVNAPIKMSGVASQFGIDISQVKKNLTKILSLQNISVDGIQIFNATRMLDVMAIKNNVSKILELAQSLSNEFSTQWKWIDIGGGFGVPYFKDESPIDILWLANAINNLFLEYKNQNTDTQFITELGRYLVAESGYLICSVQSVKKNHEKNYLIIDGGMHCHMAATGIGSFVRRNFPFEFISNNTDLKDMNEKNNYDIAGPSCTPGDTLLKEVMLTPAHKGDLIVLLNVGAYGLTASPSRFLSHGAPAEVVYFNGHHHLLRRRETEDDMWLTQNAMHNIFKPKEINYV